MIRKYLIFITVLLSCLTGCKEEFMPDVNNYEQFMVVDGTFTNEHKPATIKISKTASLESSRQLPIPFTGCTVRIENEMGASEILTETKPGNYVTSGNGIVGEAGHSYKLSITTLNNVHYETGFIKMPDPVNIKELKSESQQHESEEFVKPLGGYQFFVSTEPAPSADYYFLWKLSETYKFHSDFYILYTYEGSGFNRFTNPDSLYTCYKTENIPDFYVGTTKGLSQPQLINEPLKFVDTRTRKLQTRYSLLVKQYSINSEAYEFWREIKKQVTANDFLNTSQPYLIRGNVKNVNNQEEPVLGYFTVGSVTTKRKFVNRPDAFFFYDVCGLNTELLALRFFSPDEYPIYLTYNSERELGFSNRSCFNCTLKNGKLTPPDFWEDE